MSSEAQELSEAVASWLHYKSLVGLKGILTEASMAVPIGEYLASRYGNEVQSEVDHPLFKAKTKGRPKQIDFVRVKRGEKSWHAVYESKFQRASFKGIVEDLCRLVCLAQADGIGRPSRYFIFSGLNQTTTEFLGNSFNTGNGSRDSYFDQILKRDEAAMSKNWTFGILSLHPKQIEVFKSFAKANQVALPSRMVSRLSGLHRAGKYTCAVWEMNAAQGSKLLSAQEM